MLESCSKKLRSVVCSLTIWLLAAGLLRSGENFSLNTFSATSGDFAKAVAIFPPTAYNTTQSKNDGDLWKYLSIPYKTAQAKIGENL